MCEAPVLGQGAPPPLLCPWRRSRQCPVALGGMFRGSAAISVRLVGSLQRKKAGASLRRCLHQTVSALCCLRDPGSLGSGLVLASNPRASLLLQEAFPDCSSLPCLCFQSRTYSSASEWLLWAAASPSPAVPSPCWVHSWCSVNAQLCVSLRMGTATSWSKCCVAYLKVTPLSTPSFAVPHYFYLLPKNAFTSFFSLCPCTLLFFPTQPSSNFPHSNFYAPLLPTLLLTPLCFLKI